MILGANYFHSPYRLLALLLLLVLLEVDAMHILWGRSFCRRLQNPRFLP